MIAAFYLRLGQNIRAARQRRGLSQQVLATYLGLSRASVTNIEAGRQRVLSHDLVTVARVTRIPLTTLLRGLLH